MIHSKSIYENTYWLYKLHDFKLKPIFCKETETKLFDSWNLKLKSLLFCEKYEIFLTLNNTD